MDFKFTENDFDSYVRERVYKSLKFESGDGQLVTAGLETFSDRKIAFDHDVVFSPIVPEQYYLQNQIRKAFGKSSEPNATKIAEHPDFKSLSDGITKNHFITTMFVDIKGSTELSLKYPGDLQLIYDFKNAVIRSCIDVIRGFDGYVHRIMGDAVLGFFGSTDISRSQSILDCLNAATMLALVLENTIQPWLKKTYVSFNEKDFGFRVGCNFGDSHEILWANYGYEKVGEISPTGLPVDLAAKLQSEADTNQIMLGQGLLEYFNFPYDLSAFKQTNNRMVKFLKPEYTQNNGEKLNYIMRLLKRDDYTLGLPIGRNTKQNYIKNINEEDRIIDNNSFSLKVFISKPGSNRFSTYSSNSKILEKGSKIKVEVDVRNTRFGKWFKVNFYKVNNSGFKNEPELDRALDPEHEDHEIAIDHQADFTVDYSLISKPAKFERDCKYKGLHSIKCEVIDSNDKVIFRDYVYVPIE